MLCNLWVFWFSVDCLLRIEHFFNVNSFSDPESKQVSFGSKDFSFSFEFLSGEGSMVAGFHMRLYGTRLLVHC